MHKVDRNVKRMESAHLQLADPRAVPVGKAGPFHEELPLRPALEWGLGQRVVWLAIGARRQFGRQRGLSPRPVQNLLDLAFERRALGNTNGTVRAGEGRGEGQIRWPYFAVGRCCLVVG